MELIGRFACTVAAPPDRVWERITDVATWRGWMPDVRWAVLEGELQTGAYVTIRPVRGRQTAYRALVEPRQCFGLGLSFGPVAAMVRRWHITPAADGTLVTYTIEIGGPLAAWLARPLALRAAAAAPGLLDALRSAPA